MSSANKCRVKVSWIQSEKIVDSNSKEILEKYDGILVAPGFGNRGIEGKIEAVKYAHKKSAFFGICLGMQCRLLNMLETY